MSFQIVSVFTDSANEYIARLSTMNQGSVI
jgi:hypothetical protein